MREYAEEHNMEYLIEEWDEEKNELTVDEVAVGDKPHCPQCKQLIPKL